MVSCMLVIYSGVQTPASLAFEDYRGYYALARAPRKFALSGPNGTLVVGRGCDQGATEQSGLDSWRTTLALTPSRLMPCSPGGLLALPRARSAALSATLRCNWPGTNTMDLFIEAFFILEIVTQFFTGTFDAKGHYVDDFSQVLPLCCIP